MLLLGGHPVIEAVEGHDLAVFGADDFLNLLAEEGLPRGCATRAVIVGSKGMYPPMPTMIGFGVGVAGCFAQAIPISLVLYLYFLYN